jgi:eukaryotic-like serine/threonine-protein kinase
LNRVPDILYQIQEALADRYSIKRELGKGGMATVYLARDLRHDRFVALKVMRPDLGSSVGTERFLHEIRVTAQLRHPHILPVFDSGTSGRDEQDGGHLWYTMPYVEGETLRQRLARQRTIPTDEAIRITCEIATALEHAHRRGVVHRDVKPENILIEDEHAVIADFGVARALDKAAGERLTATGFAVGTPAYMSPEEAAGSPTVDGRADVYALGCVLYEMLTGALPFVGTPKEVIAQRLHGTPVPVNKRRSGIPRSVSDAIRKAMATRPDDRFKTAGEFADALEDSLQSGSWLTVARWRLPWRSLATAGLGLALVLAGYAGWQRGWFTPPPAASRPANLSLAVLPFANAGAPQDAHFANGVTDEIRGRLARLDSLQVIASSSTDRFRDSTRLEEVGRQLGTGYLLTGRVRREPGGKGEGRVQVSAELVQVVDSSAAVTRWQRVFDTVATDIPLVQNSIAREVARALGLGVGQAQEDVFKLEQRHDAEAYEAYLRGQQIMRQGASSPGDLQRAITEFRQAVTRDADFAAAWAQLGWAKAALWNNATADEQLLEEAKAHGERALKIGGAEAEARQVLAYYHIMKGNRGAAQEETRLGLEADPSNARLVGYSASLLELEGRWQDALRYRQRAVALDPTAAGHAAGLATNLLWLRRYPEARAAADRYIILGPSNPEAYQLRAMVALGEGKLDEARKFIRAGQAQIPPEEILPFVATYWDLYWLLDDDQKSQVLGMGPDQFYGDTVWWQTASAGIRIQRGDTAAARSLADSARRSLLATVKAMPEDAYTHSRLALVSAFLDRRDEAVREAERSISLLPIAKDALNGALLVYRLACAQARLGMEPEALATLGTLLSVPFYVSPAWLRIDPNFSELRDNPEFARLTASQ